MINIFYFKDEASDEKEYLVKNIGYLSGLDWLHNKCALPLIGSDHVTR